MTKIRAGLYLLAVAVAAVPVSLSTNSVDNRGRMTAFGQVLVFAALLSGIVGLGLLATGIVGAARRGSREIKRK